MSILANKNIVLGVTGGIAAYKSAELARRLREAGAEVRVVMTPGACAFISPLTMQAVSGQRVHETLLDAQAEAGMGHIELARWADDLIIAPATAHVMARLAHGFADDLLATLVLATEARIWLAPAMNRVMWSNAAVQDNADKLQQRGMTLLGPGSGDQACGEQGPGRMLEADEIVAALSGQAAAMLAGHRFVVTAGPTHEPLDPVRFLGNRSSGRMGFALARALVMAGAEVELVSGPVNLTTPAGLTRIDVQTAEQMRHAVMDRINGASGFVAVAAVADFRPQEAAGHKIKKTGQSMELRLVPNPDILAEVARLDQRPALVMGFAAETRDLETAARGKLAAKNLDLIAANLVGDGKAFDCPDNALEVYSRQAHWSLVRQSKPMLARQLVEIIAEQLNRMEPETA
jgi:phosphopantothenoylcysteine decarboxylase / phosphopantothenate---cysteine ligase